MVGRMLFKFNFTHQVGLLVLGVAISGCAMQASIKSTTGAQTESSSGGGTCSTANYFVKGGNSFAANTSLGNNDSFRLDLVTNALPFLSY